MNNFILHTPTKVLFGKGQVAQLRGQIPSDARILVTYGGGSVVRSGLLDQIRSELAGLTLFEFGGIEPNPTYETLMGAVELARAEKVDFLLAVGAAPCWTAPSSSPRPLTTIRPGIPGTSSRPSGARWPPPFPWAAC